VRTATPDLLLADVMMPRRDGFSLLRALRGDEQTCTLPVILLSARAGEEARVEGLMAGADDYVVKRSAPASCSPASPAPSPLAAVRREALHHEREQRARGGGVAPRRDGALELLASEREARAAAEHANRVKDDLLATVLARAAHADEHRAPVGGSDPPAPAGAGDRRARSRHHRAAR
jgi:CheY-like chemotaxis protein